MPSSAFAIGTPHLLADAFNWHLSYLRSGRMMQ